MVRWIINFSKLWAKREIFGRSDLTKNGPEPRQPPEFVIEFLIQLQIQILFLVIPPLNLANLSIQLLI